MVFAGLLNKRLASAISAEGARAIGIDVADAACFRAEPMVHNEVEGSLGFVGYLTGLNNSFIESLWREGLVPVAPCLGLGPDNELYNVNADHMAAACAEYLGAERLIYLTDVAGVLDGDKVLSAVTWEEIERLVQSRVVSGGMVLKLEAAKRALEGGVREVHIVGGGSSDSLLRVSQAPDLSHDSANDVHFADPAFEGAFGSFELENHAAGNDTRLHEALNLFPSHGRETLVAVENAGNVGEIDQTLRTEVFGAGGGHVIGIDVVQLIVGPETEARSNGNEAFAPERFDEGIIEAGEIADETEAAFDFVVNHRLGAEAGGIGGGNTDGRRAFGGNGGGKALVQ